MSKIQEIAAAIIGGKTKGIEELVNEALCEGCDPIEILNNGMIEAMSTVGEKFQKNQVFVPEMLLAARTMKKGVETLKPALAGAGDLSLGKVVIGTVAGDLHDIGKNLVSMMIESAGFEIIDLGVDVSVERFVEAVNSDPKIKIAAVSALLTTTMPAMKETVIAIKASNPNVKVLVGGAPITPEFAAECGADGYAADAAGAPQKAKELI